MVLLVTRDDIERNGPESFRVVKDIETAGHKAVSGPHIKYTNIRVPAKNVPCTPGTGAEIITHTFEISAMLVGAMGVGIQRAVFDAGTSIFAAYSRGHSPYRSTSVCWRSADQHQNAHRDLAVSHLEGSALSYFRARRTFPAPRTRTPGQGSLREAAVQSCLDAINAVGVSAYDSGLPFSDLLSTALVLPIFDGGNVGMRRQALQELIMADGYRPWMASFGAESGQQ